MNPNKNQKTPRILQSALLSGLLTCGAALAAEQAGEAVYAAGQLEASEGRALGVDLIYAPQVDLKRQPNWARNNTCYSEDPFLSGQLAIQEVSGIQSQGLMAEVKHFAFYNGQAGSVTGTIRQPELPTVVDDQTAHELYLKAFEYPIRKAKPASVMDSYQNFQIVPLQQSHAWASETRSP